MQAALEGLTRPDGTRPLLIAVTQLTSTSQERMRAKLLDAGSIQKLQVYFRTVAEKDRFLAEMLKAFPDYAVSTSIPNNIEVNALGATKGAALLFLCEQLGIRREDCMSRRAT